MNEFREQLREQATKFATCSDLDLQLAPILKDIREQSVAEVQTLRDVAGRNRRRRRGGRNWGF